MLDMILNPNSFEAALLERRLRHKAAKRGLKVVKSRSRDVRAHDFGLWGLCDVRTGNFVNPALVDRYPCSWRLDQVANYLGQA